MRYFEDDNRMRQHRLSKERGHVFTLEQVHDVVDLVLAGRRPDASYSDDECNLWSLLDDAFGA